MHSKLYLRILLVARCFMGSRLAPYQILVCDLSAILVLYAFRRAESDSGIRNAVFKKKIVCEGQSKFSRIVNIFEKTNIFGYYYFIFLVSMRYVK